MISERVKLLGSLLKRIGYTCFSMRTFKERLILQKQVYLLQAFGLYLGYRYKWYLYGPYSSDLARDGFDLFNSELFSSLPKIKFGNPKAQALFTQYLDFLGKKKNDPEWLELISSIHCLTEIYPDSSKDKIIEKVVSKQPYFNETNCEKAWEYLQDTILI